MKKSLSLSIGIPAFNEEATLGVLLNCLLNQEQSGFTISEILVVSDGSTDKTAEVVKSVKDKRVKLFVNPRRLGLNESQNQIVRRARGDILVLVDADILPKDEYFLRELIKPIIERKSVGLTSAKLLSLRLKKFYGRMLANAHEMKRYLYTHLPQQPNVYLCHGSARAFSRLLYRKIRWPEDVPEDSYSYFFALKYGFDFVFCPQAQVFFHTSTNFSDHKLQQSRFTHGQAQLKRYFDSDWVDSEYHLTTGSLLGAIARYSVKKPISVPVYLAVMVLFKLIKFPVSPDMSKFEISTSSKRVKRDTFRYNRINLKNLTKI